MDTDDTPGLPGDAGSGSAYLALLDDPVIRHMAEKLAASGRNRDEWVDADTGRPTAGFRENAAASYRALCTELKREPIDSDGGPAAAIIALVYDLPAATAADTAQPMSGYPEHDKLTAAREQTQPVGEFLEWLAGQGWFVGHYNDLGDAVPLCLPIEQLLAQWRGINLDRLELEKRQILTDMRTAAVARDTDRQCRADCVNPSSAP